MASKAKKPSNKLVYKRIPKNSDHRAAAITAETNALALELEAATLEAIGEDAEERQADAKKARTAANKLHALAKRSAKERKDTNDQKLEEWLTSFEGEHAGHSANIELHEAGVDCMIGPQCLGVGAHEEALRVIEAKIEAAELRKSDV